MFSIIFSGQDRVPDQIDEVTGKTMTVVETEVDLEEAKGVEHLLATNAKEKLAQAQVVLVDPREAVQVVQALVAALVPVLTHRDRRIKKVSFQWQVHVCSRCRIPSPLRRWGLLKYLYPDSEL